MMRINKKFGFCEEKIIMAIIEWILLCRPLYPLAVSLPACLLHRDESLALLHFFPLAKSPCDAAELERRRVFTSVPPSCISRQEIKSMDFGGLKNDERVQGELVWESPAEGKKRKKKKP